MERAVIITGGTILDYEWTASLLNVGDTIICADSGYDHAVKMGAEPNVLLGDFDSIAHIPGNCDLIRYPERKDSTDTELAVDWAMARGFREILLLGAIGSRMDHTLANIFLLVKMLDSGVRGEMVNEHNRIAVTRTELVLDESPSTLVSLVPFTDCLGVSTDNLEYPLRNAMLKPGPSLGVSNIVVTRPASVSLTSGTLVVIAARD